MIHLSFSSLSSHAHTKYQLCSFICSATQPKAAIVLRKLKQDGMRERAGEREILTKHRVSEESMPRNAVWGWAVLCLRGMPPHCPHAFTTIQEFCRPEWKLQEKTFYYDFFLIIRQEHSKQSYKGSVHVMLSAFVFTLICLHLLDVRLFSPVIKKHHIFLQTAFL